MSNRLVEPEGTYLARARSPDCGNCGQEMRKAQRIHQGTGYCAICYPRIFPQRPCHVCGRTARAHRNDEKPICGDCLREDRSCLRCGKLTPKAALRVGQRVACASCARYYRAPEPCDMCSAMSMRLSRSSAYLHNGRMCDKCLRAAVAATCSHCGKHRTVNLMTLDRKPLCKVCCAHPAASHPCPDCSATVNGLGNTPCLECAIKRSNVVQQLGAQHLLTQESVRQLYAEFTRWGNETGRASKLARGAARYLQFLVKLDAALQQRAVPLDDSVLVQVFTTEELRRMGLLSQHLAETGLLRDDAVARRRRSDERLLAARREAIAGQPWAEDFDRFEEALSTRTPAISLRTHKAYTHAALSLLTQAQVARACQISQKAVDGLLANKPGMKASLSVFVAHLNALHGLRLKLKSKTSKPVPVVRLAKFVKALLEAIESTPSRPARLALTAKLLSKLLNSPLDRILLLRHSDLDFQDLRKLRLDSQWIELPERLQPVLAALASPQWQSGMDADPLVFEGRMLLDSLSTATVDYQVNRLVRARLKG